MSNKAKANYSTSRPLVKVKAQKVSLVTQSSITLDRPKGLAESFAISVSSGHVTTTYTVHRPIGITDLEDDDWVVTPVADIPSLLSRAEDPAQGQINKARAQLKTEKLVEEELLIKDEEEIHYPKDVYDGPEDRNTLLNLADSKFAEYKRTVRDEYQKVNPKATQSELDSIKFGKVRQDFLDEKVKLHEKEIAKFLSNSDLNEEIEKAIPQTFRTMAGPLMDQPQLACVAIGKTNTTAQAIDKVNSWLYLNLVKGGVTTNPPQKKSAGAATASVTSDVKKSVISSVASALGVGKKSTSSPQEKEASAASSPSTKQ